MTHNYLLRLAVFLLVLALAVTPVSADSGYRLQVEREVYDYLTGELMLSTAAACGVLANIEHESAFQPTVFGDQGTSYGLCQWHNERFTALRNYSAALGLSYQSVEGQMAYLKYELGNNYTNLLLTLQSIDDTPDGAYRAAYLWCVQFERPSNAQVKAAARGELARGKYWNRYQGFESVIILPQPEEPEPDPELLLEQLKQNPVTIPAAPEKPGADRDEFPKPEKIYYTPWNLPGLTQTPPATTPRPKTLPWQYPALGMIGGLMVIVWLFPEKKGKSEVYSRGHSVVE